MASTKANLRELMKQKRAERTGSAPHSAATRPQKDVRSLLATKTSSTAPKKVRLQGMTFVESATAKKPSSGHSVNTSSKAKAVAPSAHRSSTNASAANKAGQGLLGASYSDSGSEDESSPQRSTNNAVKNVTESRSVLAENVKEEEPSSGGVEGSSQLPSDFFDNNVSTKWTTKGLSKPTAAKEAQDSQQQQEQQDAMDKLEELNRELEETFQKIEDETNEEDLLDAEKRDEMEQLAYLAQLRRLGAETERRREHIKNTIAVEQQISSEIPDNAVYTGGELEEAPQSASGSMSVASKPSVSDLLKNKLKRKRNAAATVQKKSTTMDEQDNTDGFLDWRSKVIL